MGQTMTRKFSRILGAVLLGSALLALCCFLPQLFPTRVSESGFTIIKYSAVTQIALRYLCTGLAAGFGLALMFWPLGTVSAQTAHR